MKRIAVFGGRDFDDMTAVWNALDRALVKHGPFILVHGACPTGADAHAAGWARNRVVLVDPFPADWDKYKKAAGPIRNREMAQSGLDGAIQFPGNRGTGDMREQCDEAGVPVWEPMTRENG